MIDGRTAYYRQAEGKNALMSLYKSLIRPILFRMDSEGAHNMLFRLAGMGESLSALIPERAAVQEDCLKSRVAGRAIANPVGLAAGFDKNAHILKYYQKLGFGLAEVGSITARPSPGNPRPRLFRLPEDDAVINRMGFNGDGAEVVATRLKDFGQLPVAINIAKTNDPAIKGDKAVEDMVFSFNQIKNMPFHYVVFDISCPNTHEGRVDNADELDQTLAKVRPLNQLNLPIFVKLSPDSPLEFLQTIAALGITHGVKGYVCGNTSQMRSNLKTSAQTIESIGRGGLSGAPLKGLAVKLCARMYDLKGPGQEIIGSGGVMNGQDAYDFIKAGASAVQIYTALVYEGPFAANVINRELAELLKKDQTRVEEAIGTSAHLLSASAQHI